MSSHSLGRPLAVRPRSWAITRTSFAVDVDAGVLGGMAGVWYAVSSAVSIVAITVSIGMPLSVSIMRRPDVDMHGPGSYSLVGWSVAMVIEIMPALTPLGDLLVIEPTEFELGDRWS